MLDCGLEVLTNLFGLTRFVTRPIQLLFRMGEVVSAKGEVDLDQVPFFFGLSIVSGLIRRASIMPWIFIMVMYACILHIIDFG